MQPNFNEERYQAAKRVTWVSAGTNSALAIGKIIIGYFGHSHALVADGLHSFSDLISDGLVLIAARMGKRLPDKEHPYGHQRIETIAAMLIALMLLSVAASLVYDAATHLSQGKALALHSGWIITAALISIVANEWLFRYTLAAGKRWQSSLLITNAYHNRSDVLVSAIVLFAAIGSFSGIHLLDAIGAIIIALLIAKMGIKMFYTGIKELIDTAVDEDTLVRINACISKIPGVVSIHQLRTRLHGGKVFVDVHIIVNPLISVSEGHHIGEQVHWALLKNCVEVADVTVHIDPENDETTRPSIHLPNRDILLKQLTPLWQALPGFSQIERINLHYLNGEIFIELLMPESAAIHKNAEALDLLYQAAVKDLTFIKQVVVHIL